MKVTKSTRHSKITGDFAEHLTLYWLSKYGFECALIDHTGIDIIAKNPHTDELMGISVKSRSRNTGKEGQLLNIPNDNFIKAKAACKAFECIPYFAIVVDQGDMIYGFITPMKHFLKLHPQSKRYSCWRMTEQWIQKYRNDKKVKMFEFNHKTLSWW